MKDTLELFGFQKNSFKFAIDGLSRTLDYQCPGVKPNNYISIYKFPKTFSGVLGFWGDRKSVV